MKLDEKVHQTTVAVRHTTVLNYLNKKNSLSQIVNHLFYKWPSEFKWRESFFISLASYIDLEYILQLVSCDE